MSDQDTRLFIHLLLRTYCYIAVTRSIIRTKCRLFLPSRLHHTPKKHHCEHATSTISPQSFHIWKNKPAHWSSPIALPRTTGSQYSCSSKALCFLSRGARPLLRTPPAAPKDVTQPHLSATICCCSVASLLSVPPENPATEIGTLFCKQDVPCHSCEMVPIDYEYFKCVCRPLPMMYGRGSHTKYIWHDAVQSFFVIIVCSYFVSISELLSNPKVTKFNSKLSLIHNS